MRIVERLVIRSGYIFQRRLLARIRKADRIIKKLEANGMHDIADERRASRRRMEIRLREMSDDLSYRVETYARAHS